MEKHILRILKILLITGAAVLLILRYATYRMADQLGAESVSELNMISYIAGGVALISAVIWAVIEKKKNAPPENYEFNPPDWVKKDENESSGQQTDENEPSDDEKSAADD